MTRILNVHLLPELANPHDLAGHCSVVIDVLRASTTITTALAAGARKIIPCLTVEEARQLAEQRPGSLLGGERQGKPPSGFDFGNSPSEYAADAVNDKTIVFTTTNGTKAMTRCIGSGRILVGSIVNRAAVCRAILGAARVDLVCAGTGGEFSMDDALGAGAIIERLALEADWRMNDAAETCRSLWAHVVSAETGRQAIAQSLAKSIGGRNLIEIGMEDDLPQAAELDRYEIVPELDRSVWEISA